MRARALAAAACTTPPTVASGPVAVTLAGELPPAHHRTALVVGQLHCPRGVVAQAVAETDAGPGEAEIPGVVIGRVEVLRLERLDGEVGAKVVEGREGEPAPRRQLDLPLDLGHQRRVTLPFDAGAADTASWCRASSAPGPRRCHMPSASISQAGRRSRMSSVASRRARWAGSSTETATATCRPTWARAMSPEARDAEPAAPSA